MTYRDSGGPRLDLSSSGRGQLQTILLLAHLESNSGSVLLLDEPDAHLEVLRQRQTYRMLGDASRDGGNQVIVASHSEVVMGEAVDRGDAIIAFVGQPHRVENPTQLAKALREIGFEDYLLAEQRGWVLYLEGSTDLSVLLAFAAHLDHPVRKMLELPFAVYVGDQPKLAKRHFYALREAAPSLAGVAIYDRLDSIGEDPNLLQLTWNRREIENYLCDREALLDLAEEMGRPHGPLFAVGWRATMESCIEEVSRAAETFGLPSPWGADIKASDDFLDRLFPLFSKRTGDPNRLVRKSDYHRLIAHMKPDDISPEVGEKLDAIAEVARRAERLSPAGDD